MGVDPAKRVCRMTAPINPNDRFTPDTPFGVETMYSTWQPEVAPAGLPAGLPAVGPDARTDVQPRLPSQQLSQPAQPVQVPEPMSVVWQGVEYAAARWDVHGFNLETAIPRIVAPGPGRVIDVTLLIGQGGTRIEMRVQARLEAGDDAAPTRFAFVAMERAQAEVLHRIVDSVVSKQTMSLTRLLNETEDTRAARKETGERVRSIRTGFQLTMAGLVLVVAAMTTWSKFATVSARYAAVTVGATSLSVPIAGRISAMTVLPGETVAEGDVLGYVRPTNFEDRLEGLSERLRAVEVERNELLARRDAMTQLSGITVQSQSDERSRLEASLAVAERRLGVEQSLLASLQSNGLPTASRLRERSRQEADVLQAETQVLDMRARLATLSQAEMLAPMGLSQAGLRNGSATLQSVDLRLAALDAEITHISDRQGRATYGEPIVSPCDCTVQSIERRVGEWAEPSHELAMMIGAETPTIHALILSETARSIDLGDRAVIELANGTSLNGHVTRMNYEAQWRGYAGLQDNVFAADRYARMEIVPERPLNAPVGMVAQVTVQTNGLFGFLTGLVGF